MTQISYKHDPRFDHPVAVEIIDTEPLNGFRRLVRRHKPGVQSIIETVVMGATFIAYLAFDFVLSLLVLPFTNPD